MRTRKTRPRLTAALLPALTLAACSLFAATTPGRRASARSVRVASTQARAASAPSRGVMKRASLGGVSFNYDASLASDAKGEVAPAVVCGKPGDVLPVHLAFTLKGYPKPHASPFMQPPEIQIFPVAEYRRALAACEKDMAAVTEPPADYYVSDFDAQLRTLKALNVARPAPRTLRAWLRKHRGRDHWEGRMPFVPMYDVGEALRAKVSYIDFRGGHGVAFVTQYMMEDTLVSNQALAYVFQGLTDDGNYYVSAAFPSPPRSFPTSTPKRRPRDSASTRPS